MHRIAEQGVAAHWRYKDGTNVSEGDDQRVVWMRQLIEWAREMREPSDFLSTLKVDLYPDEVYIFTPKGKVLTLPRGATPVDFAYTIHTEVGHQCVGAKVNGQMVPLRHPLSNGDVVEIVTQKGHGPSRDWLSFVRTSHARSKIRQWINLNERKQATEVGRRLIEREARQAGVSLKKISEEELLRVATEYGRAKLEDLYADLGIWKIFRPAGSGETDGPADRGKAPRRRARTAQKLVSSVKRMLGIRDPSILVLGPRQPHGLSRQVLQSDSRRSHHRLCDARPRRGRAQHFLPQCAETALSIRAAHHRAMERRGAGHLSGHAGGARQGSARTAGGHHRRHQLAWAPTFRCSTAGPTTCKRASKPPSISPIATNWNASLENMKRISGVFGVERVYQV